VGASTARPLTLISPCWYSEGVDYQVANHPVDLRMIGHYCREINWRINAKHQPLVSTCRRNSSADLAIKSCAE